MPTSEQILRFLRSRLRGITLRCLDRDGFTMITARELSNLFPDVEFPQSRNGNYKLCSSPESSFVVAESWFCDQPDEFFETFPFTDGISWKEQLGPIRHQHGHKLCATFAAVDLVRAHSLIANRGLVDLSVWYLCHMVDPDCLVPRRSQPHHRCYRSHVETVLSYIKSEGAPLRFDFEEEENPELFCYYPVRRPVSLVTPPISSIETIDSLQEALMSLHLGPITATLLVFPELYTIEDGIYRGPTEQNSTLEHYHAVNICSVVYHDCGEPVAICKLSDGVEIGIEGYVYVSLSIVLQFLSDGFSHVPIHLLRDFVILEMEPVEIEQETRMEKGENSQSSRDTPPPPPKEDCPSPPHPKEDCPPSQSFHSARVGEDVSEVDAYEYMVEYSQTNKLAGRLENVVGWYHSHPGYGCRLSGIDVSTQMLNQQYQEPFLAVVIDPTRTVSAGKVEIGALRTYPEGHKILYLLWTKYWLNTLLSSPLLGNGDYVAGRISDLAETVEQAQSQLAHSRFGDFILSKSVDNEILLWEPQLKENYPREITLYNCLDDGGISALQSFADEDKEESFYTVSWACGVNGNPFVAAGGVKGIIRVIDVNNEMIQKSLVGHGDSVNEIRTQPLKPQLVITASKDESVRLWNVETGICILIFAGAGGHRYEVLSVDFHPSDIYGFASCGMEEFWTYVEKSYTWTDDPSKFPTKFVQFPVFTASIHTNYVDCNRWFGDLILSKAGRLENDVGWYHSHPGYGCRLSGIDVSTQMLNQQYQEPFLAVVIDPTRTVSAGKVEIRALRTYPEGHKISDDHVSEYQTIPLNKIEDFGVHCKQYYLLDIAYLKSSLDSHILYLLWNKYSLNTLSSSPLLGNGDYVARKISDLVETVEQAQSQLAHSRFGGIAASLHRKKEDEPPLAKITRNSAKINVEQVHGLTSQVIRDILFNSARQSEKTPSDPLDPEPLITS